MVRAASGYSRAWGLPLCPLQLSSPSDESWSWVPNIFPMLMITVPCRKTSKVSRFVPIFDVGIYFLDRLLEQSCKVTGKSKLVKVCDPQGLGSNKLVSRPPSSFSMGRIKQLFSFRGHNLSTFWLGGVPRTKRVSRLLTRGLQRQTPCGKITYLLFYHWMHSEGWGASFTLFSG